SLPAGRSRWSSPAAMSTWPPSPTSSPGAICTSATSPSKGAPMPYDVTVLTESELRRVVHLDLQAVDIVEQAFAALASGKVVMPPILSMAIPEANGEVDVKTAWIPGFDGFAIKVSPGFFDNPRLGLPSLNGLMILFSARTGLVEAML